MITIEQCRAARGLLNWTQGDLAEATGISKTSINNFERGLSDAKADTLASIRDAFERGGIEFFPPYGVNKVVETIEILHGAEGFQKLWDDIFMTLKNSGGEVCISGVDESLVVKHDSKGAQEHLERLKEYNISERLLAKEGDTTFLQPIDCYRWLPEIVFKAAAPTFIYGEKMAIKLWHEKMIILIRSKTAAEAEQKRFELLWEMGKKPQID